MTIGPSMANIVQFYGHRKAYGLSVSPNPLHRNPSYEPLRQPRPRDPRQRAPVRGLGLVLGRALAVLRASGCCGYVDRYNGRVVHTETLAVPDRDGRALGRSPLIIVYEVRP